MDIITIDWTQSKKDKVAQLISQFVSDYDVLRANEVHSIIVSDLAGLVSDIVACVQPRQTTEMKMYRDKELEKYWTRLGNVSVDDNGKIETQFIIGEERKAWDIGTDREDIWEWFDQEHSEGVHKLMYKV